MSERYCVYRYTESGAHPATLLINRDADGALSLSIIARHVATVELSLPEFRKMVEACRDEELVQVVGALIHTGKA